MKIQELAIELHRETLRLAMAGKPSDEEVRAIKRIGFDAQRLYGLVYEHQPEAHGTDAGYGDVS